MSMEAYSVAIRLRLVDMVTPALGLIGRGMHKLSGDTNAAQKNVADLEKRLHSIQRLGLVGGVLAGAGAFGLSLFDAPLKAARDYELAFTRFKTLNLGDTVNKQADQFARSANLMGVSGKDLMRTMSESVGLFGSYAEAQKLAPKIAMLNQANSAIFHGKIEGIDEGAARSIVKFIDRRGGTKDEASFMHNLDLAQKMVTGSGGFIKFRDLDQFSQQGGTAFRGLSDAGILNMSLLLQEQGGSRAGTALMSLYQNLVAGRTPKKTMAMLQDFGLGHLAMETHATVGGKSIKSLVMRDIKDSALLQSNPAMWMQTVFLQALARKHIIEPSAILKYTNDLLSNRTASNQASIMTTQLLQLMRDADLAKNAMGYDQTLDAWKKDPNSKFANLSARWTDTLRELGTVVLPIAIKGLEGLISLLKRASSFAHEFPAFTKGLVLASAAIFALAAAGGTLMLFRAGLQGVGLALNVLSLGAGGGMLASVATGLTALGSALPGLLGKLGLLGFVGYGTYSIATALGADKLGSWIGGKVFDWTHPDGGQMLTQPGGKGFHARGNEADGSPFVKNNAGAGRGYINNTIVMPNGQTLAKVVTHEQSRAAARPQTGTSAFDGRAGLLPAGAN